MKLAKAIFKYQLLSFSRLKMSPFKTPPDFIAIILSIGFITFLTVALASENPFIVNEKKILNFNYIVFFFYIASFFSEGYIIGFYTPNYKYIKLLFPMKLKTQILLDFLSELFSYKILILIFSLLSFIIVSITYKITLWSSLNIVGIILIILSYINSCLLIQLIKDKMRKNAFNFNKNFFKLFFFLLMVIATINSNLNFVNFKELKTAYSFLIISIFLPIFFVLIIFRINTKQDKI
jgi:hypothetical protein